MIPAAEDPSWALLAAAPADGDAEEVAPVWLAPVWLPLPVVSPPIYIISIPYQSRMQNIITGEGASRNSMTHRNIKNINEIILPEPDEPVGVPAVPVGFGMAAVALKKCCLIQLPTH